MQSSPDDQSAFFAISESKDQGFEDVKCYENESMGDTGLEPVTSRV